eukprot:gene13739-biopygen14134
MLHELGADLSRADNYGETPAHSAAGTDQADSLRVLHELGADLSHADNDGETPAHSAARGGQANSVRVLHELGADVSHADNDGRTPAHSAAEMGEVDSLRVLYELGADLSHADNDGRPTAHSAARGGIEAAEAADGLISAFQTAFDDEDDASFARLCARCDHPVVRQDEVPFTFDMNIDVGLRAHAPRHFPMVHFGSATPAVIGPHAVTHEPEEPAVPHPQHQFIDGEPPFEKSFMDNVSVQLGFYEAGELTVAAVPALFMRLRMCIMGTAAGSALCVDTAPQSVLAGDCVCCYQDGTVDFVDTAFLDSDFCNIFNLDPGGAIDSGTAGISNLPNSIDTNTLYNSEHCISNHSQVARVTIVLLVVLFDLLARAQQAE